MSIKELLVHCYETGDNININLELSKSIQLEDIFTIIYLVTDKGCELKLDDTIYEFISSDDIIIDLYENHYSCLNIENDVTNPLIIAMLYLIYQDNKDYYPLVFHGKNRLVYDNNVYFLDLANSMCIIHYSKVIYIMSILNISSTKQSGTVDYFVQCHLGLISHIKSARKT